MRERVRVAAAQVAPVMFDRAATLERALEVIREAGRREVDLVVFPEAFFTAYPYWRGHVTVKEATELAVRIQESALRIPGVETRRLAEAARQAGVNCVLGVNELDDRPGSLTVYNTALVVGRDGRLVGRHRKLIPTHGERAYWGRGDGRDLTAFDLDVGRVGALICYEHHMSLVRAALGLDGEEIHCALWPGWWTLDGHLGAKRGLAGATPSEVDAAIREYAVENQVFVVSVSAYLPPSAGPPELEGRLGYRLAVGGSAVISPSGLYLAGPVFEREELVVADLEARERRLAKAYLDTVGHYARPDLLDLKVRKEPPPDLSWGDPPPPPWSPPGPPPAGLPPSGDPPRRR
jgi:nitrilase